MEVAKDWTLEVLDKAVEYGAHSSTRTPAAAQACREEALEKVAQGFVKLIPWRTLREQIQKGLHANTKVSPIAATQHKSRLYQMILDLSCKGQGRHGQGVATAVNELTNEEAAFMAAMDQLGKVLPRLIFTIACTCA